MHVGAHVEAHAAALPAALAAAHPVMNGWAHVEAHAAALFAALAAAPHVMHVGAHVDAYVVAHAMEVVPVAEEVAASLAPAVFVVSFAGALVAALVVELCME